MLENEINEAQRLVKTDAYQMSIGEIVSMYESKELIIDPDFQRLFRWTLSQKSKLIESILLGIPLPSIFVFEKSDGTWELIDGLQRISTLLEFMGVLKDHEGNLIEPSALEATKYLPSLHNAVWIKTERITELPIDDQNGIDKSHQLAIRRARIGVEILKRPSDSKTKYDLFQRLNAGGSQANSQELRNCIMLMVNPNYFCEIKKSAENASFKKVFSITDEHVEKQKHMELAVRFLVHTLIPYDGILDVEEYIDDGIIAILSNPEYAGANTLIDRTFLLLNKIAGSDVLRRHDGMKFTGRVGLVGLEVVAVGIAKNIEAISELGAPEEFIKKKIEDFWKTPDSNTMTSPGLRGTTRIKRTVPFGEEWFKP